VQYNLGPLVGVNVSQDQDILARTIYGEARGQGRAAMENVASVIMNRWKLRQDGSGYKSFGPVGATVAEICLAPKQFSCWNENDPNAAVCRQVTTADATFRAALDVAGNAIDGALEDKTGGADHYFASSMASLPKWADSTLETLKDAGHRFLKLVT
jgi:N-acetylmuramoyl-L-alanine amidase